MSEQQEQGLYREIGRRIRKARTDRNMAQDELAVAVKLSRVSIVNIEMGKQRSPVHMLYRIAQELQVDPHDLLPAIQRPSGRSREEIPHALKDEPTEVQEFYERLVTEEPRKGASDEPTGGSPQVAKKSRRKSAARSR